MRKQLPLVSVIIPTKNSSKFLENCLLSIKKQSYKRIEIIVVDNFSKDDTYEIAKKYTNKVYLHGKERSSQRNFGATKANGKYLFFIDSDMELTNGVFFECVDITNDENIKAIVVPEESFGEGFWSKCKRLERSFYVGVDFMEATRFFEKKAFQEVGGFDVNLISGEDWYLSQKLEKYGQIGHAAKFIRHNEGRLTFWKTVGKKYYYSKHFIRYVNLEENIHIKEQTSIISRYKLFFSRPKILFYDPVLGLGMLIMKTSEFIAGGLGYGISILKNINILS